MDARSADALVHDPCSAVIDVTQKNDVSVVRDVRDGLLTRSIYCTLGFVVARRLRRIRRFLAATVVILSLLVALLLIGGYFASAGAGCRPPN